MQHGAGQLQSAAYCLLRQNNLNGIPQYQHLRFDGKQWHYQIVSKRTQPFALEGLRGPADSDQSAGDVIWNDNAYIVFRGDLTHNLTVCPCCNPRITLGPAENTQILWDEDIGFAEPVIDREIPVARQRTQHPPVQRAN